jgi:serine/threonine protein kinase
MERIGPYKVLEQVGEGGVGLVFRCLDPGGEHEVAIKLLKAGAEADDRQRERFMREVRALARLDHPGVVKVQQLGIHEEAPYIVMALVEGRSLAEALHEDGPLAPPLAATLLGKVAETIQFAHDRGILHRDLKPENILIGADGEPLLTDFGLCKDLSRAGRRRFTMRNTVIGTFGYLAPEQLQGDPDAIGPTSDVFGLGATLFAALTGAPPYDGASVREVIQQTLEGAVPVPSTARPGLAAGFDWVCARAMAPAPGDRYPNARALAEDLRRLARGEELVPELDLPVSEDDRKMGRQADAIEESMRTPLAGIPALQEPTDLASLMQRGEDLFTAGEYTEAVYNFSQAADLAPDDIEVRLRCAVAKRKSGDPRGALRDYDAALAIRPAARAYVGRAAARCDAKDFIGATDDFQRALRMLPMEDPRRPKIIAALRKSQSSLGDTVLRGQVLDMPTKRLAKPDVPLEDAEGD